ncbi:hypothetical protein CASFOL_007328 [Castilleja foliolosa]|uniref:Peptidase A1 domain-containing protein n=1 Tax=Castilleja foliolosa TaxID=1961234 RepID=A0ABD3E8X5_9LAMI
MATLNFFIPSMSIVALFIISCFPGKSLQALESKEANSESHPIGSESVAIVITTNGDRKNPNSPCPIRPKLWNRQVCYHLRPRLTPSRTISPFQHHQQSNLESVQPRRTSFRLDLYFNPPNSNTYSSIPCNSTLCTNFFPSNSQNCNSSKMCIYRSEYDDHSASDGIFSLDKLNMTGESSDLLFLCVPFSASSNAGLLGLGRGDLSLPGQIGVMYNNYFSYCLPSNSDSSAKTTRHSSYFIRIVAIAVGGRNLQIDYKSQVLQNPGTIIDSGTFITHLPAEAYAPMRDAFMQLMNDYPMAPAYGILDTCYLNSTDKQIDMNNVPAVSFTFDGNLTVDFDASGIFYVVDPTLVCFAFADNTHPPSLSVFGNAQQKKMEVVYDVGNQKLGFRPNGCD